MKAQRMFFGELRDGRLARLPFLAWTMVLMLIVLGLGLAIGAAVGIVQNTMGGDPLHTEALLEELLATPFALLLPLIGLVVMFAQYNMVAKRARDIGLRGWLTVLAVLLLTGIAGATLSESAIGLINGLVGLALLLVPSDALRRGG